jgi:hypothetical protein
MEKTSRTIISKTTLLLTLALAMSTIMAGTSPSFASDETPTIQVSPSTYLATHLDEIFYINVNIKNVTEDLHLIGVEWKLKYNTTILEVLNVTEGGFFKNWAEAAGLDPDDVYFWWLQEEDYVISFTLYVQFALIPPTVFPEGSGTLATITFKATHRLIEPEPEASCILELTDTMLLDVDEAEITHNSENGYYEITPLSFPGVTVTPDLYVATHIGETFDVNIDIENLDRDWRLIGAQFKLHYNTTLLETKENWIIEGSFLRQFAPYGTWFTSHVEYDYGLVGILILPNETGASVEPFPEGNGTLATITFNATYLPWKPESSCLLQLNDTLLIDVNIDSIPHTISHGYYEVGPYLALVPDTGFAATTIIGGRFAANSKITITWDGKPITTVPSPLTTDSSGNFTAIITVLNPTDPGLYNVTSTDQEGNKANATFTVIDMKGETGDKGDPGETGDKGDPGETGDKGDPGETGDKGDPGETGDKGDPGEPAPTEIVWASIVIAIIAIVIAAYVLLMKKT